MKQVSFVSNFGIMCLAFYMVGIMANDMYLDQKQIIETIMPSNNVMYSIERYLDNIDLNCIVDDIIYPTAHSSFNLGTFESEKSLLTSYELIDNCINDSDELI